VLLGLLRFGTLRQWNREFVDASRPLVADCPPGKRTCRMIALINPEYGRPAHAFPTFTLFSAAGIRGVEEKLTGRARFLLDQKLQLRRMRLR
jgi:hypothetical protein